MIKLFDDFHSKAVRKGINCQLPILTFRKLSHDVVSLLICKLCSFPSLCAESPKAEFHRAPFAVYITDLPDNAEFWSPNWAARGASWLFLIKVLQNAQLCLEEFALRWLQLSLTFTIIYLVSSHQGSQSAKELFLLGWLTWGIVSLRQGWKWGEGLL